MSRTLEALRRIESRNAVAPQLPPAAVDVDRAPPSCGAPADADGAPATGCAVADQAPPPDSPAAEAPANWLPVELPAEWLAEWPATEVSPQADAAKICWLHRAEPSAGYARLAVRLLAQDTVHQPTTILFTSPGDGDGKTELLLTLAPLLAARAQRGLLVVDADFRRSDLSTRLAAFNDGLAGLLAGTATIAEVICPTTLPHLNILPHGDHLLLEEEVDIQLSAWQSVLSDLKRHYPLVLLDAPSLAHAHVARMASSCDGVCLVVRLGQTSRRALREAVHVTLAAGGHLLGCIAVSG